ncbi:hypothetical protein [Streptomyces sp. NPDC050485]|uniref:hypothetical protein n=1 Tax=Streptomyces sp. NPDC050485 TaxID=3365617 RepID=UPI00379A0273
MTTHSVSRSRALVRAAALAGALAAVSLAPAGTASAEGNPTTVYDSNGEDTLMSMDKCADHTDNFRFRFFYHSGEAGAWVNVGHPIYDLKSIAMGGSGGGNHPLSFCDQGDGAGQAVANNSASVHNWYDGYCGSVYYSAGYKGAKETIWHNSGADLSATKNNNRSVNFSTCW